MRPGLILGALALAALAGALAACDRPPAPPPPAPERITARLAGPPPRDTAPDDAARAGAAVCPVHGLPLLRDVASAQVDGPDGRPHPVRFCQLCRAKETLDSLGLK